MSDPLYTNPDLAQFYDLENGWSDDFDFCAKMATQAESVLDIGCGTGEFLSALRRKRAVGIDPAGAMLDLARNRKGGAKYACGTMRSMRPQPRLLAMKPITNP